MPLIDASEVSHAASRIMSHFGPIPFYATEVAELTSVQTSKNDFLTPNMASPGSGLGDLGGQIFMDNSQSASAPSQKEKFCL